MKNIINDPKHNKTKKIFKILGVILTTLGACLIIIGLIDFFTAMSNLGSPNFFWCLFVGFIVLGIGLKLCHLGFMKQMTSYVASQTVPVAKDSINYLASNTKESLSEAANSISNSMKNGNQIRCINCNALNNSDAKFCQNCGKQLIKLCPKCNKANNLTASYCDNCGTRL